MPKPIFVSNFEPVLPKFSAPQKELVEALADVHDWAAKAVGLEIPAKKFVLRFGVKNSQVSCRYFESQDLYQPPAERSLYKISKETPQGATIDTRMRMFNARAKEIFEGLYPASAKAPDHIIHVTCTGYCAPSAPQLLAAEREWKTEITHAYHMGCYASLPAIRIAGALAIAQDRDVHVVHTEMCTLHMDPLGNLPEQIVAQTLFADGHIRYRVHSGQARGFRLLEMIERLAPNTAADIQWTPAAFGMQMELSRSVPEKVRANVREVLLELVQRCNLSLDDVLKNALFAVHPGGPRIIEAVEEVLELKAEQVAASKKILFERGNMSSSTLPHVWHEIQQSGIERGRIVISFAFGPGITIFASAFEAQ
jgi:predicted naringenin-chalcone synthase